MKTWTTEMWLEGMPEEILDVLTDPAAIARWAPMDFQCSSSTVSGSRRGRMPA
jgi:hypothetical protein